MPKTWFITGCSTGFGRLLTQALHARGDNVVATARKVETLADLGTSDEERILRLSLDVTAPAQIEAAVEAALARFGAIDVLVNNAGYGYFSVQEEGDLAEIRAMYETNVFGLISMTQAVLPHMRKQASGTIVNLSSIAGRIGSPRSGFYQSTKWAVEALSESLHHETGSFGIKIVVIEPGLFSTDFPMSARRQDPEVAAQSPYARVGESWTRNFGGKYFTEKQDPQVVVNQILRGVDEGQRFVRIPVGADSRMLVGKREEHGFDGFVSWLHDELHEGA
ncbi:MAG: SDR family oxidoreductase [Candidatus Eisenbacteria bacterium]